MSPKSLTINQGRKIDAQGTVAGSLEGLNGKTGFLSFDISNR